MTLRPRTRVSLLLLAFACSATLASAQGRRDDYEKAGQFLTESIRDLAYDGQVDPQWIGKSNRFWYRKEGPSGKQFVLVDAAALTTAPAFDHDRIAAALSSATKQSFTARALPFDAIRLTDPSTTPGAIGRSSSTPSARRGRAASIPTPARARPTRSTTTRPARPEGAADRQAIACREPRCRRPMASCSPSCAITISGSA